MSTFQVQKSEPVLSKRSFGLATVAAFIGCVACCALPLLAAAGLGSGVVGALSSVFRPGAELWVGGSVFLLVLAVAAVRNRLKRGAAVGCSETCAADGSCCARGTTVT